MPNKDEAGSRPRDIDAKAARPRGRGARLICGKHIVGGLWSAHRMGARSVFLWNSYKSAPAAVSILYALPTYFRAPRAMVVRWSLRRPQPDIPTLISRIFVLRRLSHVGHHPYRGRPRLLRPVHCLRLRLRSALRSIPMLVD